MSSTRTGRSGHGVVLVVAALVSKLLGAIYRIPLTNILGVEGIGIYQLVFPVYALMLTLSSSGIPTAISRLVSERMAVGDAGGSRNIVRTASILLTLLGFVFALLMALLSLPLATLAGRAELVTSYLVLAPSVLFVSASAVIRGYYEGNMLMAPTAVKELVSQSVKMGAGLMLASYLSRYGIVMAVTGAVLGVTISEAMSLLVLLVMYIRRQKPNIDMHISDIRVNSREIIRVAMPISGAGIVMPIVQVVDSILIVQILRLAGEDIARATSLYGLLQGPVSTLVNMPIVVILAIAVMIVPVVSAGRARHDANFVRTKTAVSLKVAYMVGVPSFFGMFAVAGDIMAILYPALSKADLELGAWLLRLASFSIISLSLMEIYSSLLSALDKSRVGLRTLIAGAVVKVAISVPLIYYLSISGACIANLISYGIVAVLDMVFMRKYLGVNEGLMQAVAKILISGIAMLAVILPITHFVSNIYVAILVAVPLGVAIYAVFMLLLRVMTRDELYLMPLGKLLVYLDKRIHKER